MLGQIPKGGMAAELIVDKISGVAPSNVTATNKDTGEVLQINVESNRYKFLAYNYGNYEVSYSIGDKQPVKEDIVVDVCKQYIVTVAGNPDLNSNSWADISEVSSKGLASSIWSVGDAKEIELNGTIAGLSLSNYKTWVYILGFNHNSEREGNNLIHFGCFRNDKEYNNNNSIALVDSRYSSESPENYFIVNESNNNNGGWASCDMRNEVINASAISPSQATSGSFLAVLPNDLKTVLKQCKKYTCNRSGGTGDEETNINSTQDWAFLLSEFEVHGKRTFASVYEQNYQQQYEYYKLGNSKVKYKHNDVNNTCDWWCRSLCVNYTNLFCTVYFNGSAHGSAPNFSYGFAPGFCV